MKPVRRNCVIYIRAASFCVWGDERSTRQSVTHPPDLGLLIASGTETTPPARTDTPRTTTTIYCTNRVNPFPGMSPYCGHMCRSWTSYGYPRSIFNKIISVKNSLGTTIAKN
ncbi:hypothetical protein J6590_101080 [Homalodisca vitripennis]|nr:hypothetical protein J6590_101080 [Homalodisca vitripennis]